MHFRRQNVGIVDIPHSLLDILNLLNGVLKCLSVKRSEEFHCIPKPLGCDAHLMQLGNVRRVGDEFLPN